MVHPRTHLFIRHTLRQAYYKSFHLYLFPIHTSISFLIISSSEPWTWFIKETVWVQTLWTQSHLYRICVAQDPTCKITSSRAVFHILLEGPFIYDEVLRIRLKFLKAFHFHRMSLPLFKLSTPSAKPLLFVCLMSTDVDLLCLM